MYSFGKILVLLFFGNYITEQSKIIFEQEQYYRKLYSSNHLCVDNDFFFQHDVKLSDEQKKTLWRGIYHSRNVVNLLN